MCVATAALGLNDEQGDHLFFPPDVVSWWDITPQQAAECMRNLATTGIVDWTRVLPEDNHQ